MKLDEYFIKERTGHLTKINQIWIFFVLSFELVNCKHRSKSTYECMPFAGNRRCFVSNFPIYYD